MTRWTAGLLLGFGLVLAVNGAMLWLALDDPPAIDPAYELERDRQGAAP